MSTVGWNGARRRCGAAPRRTAGSALRRAQGSRDHGRTMSIDPHVKHAVPIAEGLAEITRAIAAARIALQGAGDPGLAVRGGEVTIDFELAMLEGGAVGMRVGGNPPGVTRDNGNHVRVTLALGGVDPAASVERTGADPAERAQIERARAEAVRERQTAEREHRAAEAALGQAEELRRAIASAVAGADARHAPEARPSVDAGARLADEILEAVARLDHHVAHLGLRASVTDALRGELQAIRQVAMRGDLAAANEALSRFVTANAPLLRPGA